MLKECGILMNNIKDIRKNFPNLSVNYQGNDLIYFDNAATTLKPQLVIDSVIRHYKEYTANVHRGIHFLSEKATLEFDASREKVRNFINADSNEEIVFTKGATESINMIAQTYGRTFFEQGDEIIISEMEHHSNIVPWQILCEQIGCKLKIIPINDSGELDCAKLDELITDRTKILSIVYISNALGTINPIDKLIKKAHDKGTIVLIDAAQAVSHMPVDVKKLDCDFLVFSGHKIFGPTGIGVLYGKKSLLEKMPPYQSGGDMILSVDFDKTIYNKLPYKFEAGTPNIAGVLGLGSALDYVKAIGWDKIMKYEQHLKDYMQDKLSKNEDLKLIGTAKEKSCVFSFIVKDVHAHDVGTLLSQKAIAIRTGHHCTQPIMKHFKIPATARASLSFYNTEEEIDKFIEALKSIRGIFQ